MATTTQILFNSPALHSLKRDQLVKLCKTHSLKANGKNVELIERLKQHAETLPKDSPLSIASRSEDTASNGMRTDTEEAQETASLASMPRPSEQWEMMESIPELEENSSQGSLNSKTGEFGTGSSKSTLSYTRRFYSPHRPASFDNDLLSPLICFLLGPQAHRDIQVYSNEHERNVCGCSPSS